MKKKLIHQKHLKQLEVEDIDVLVVETVADVQVHVLEPVEVLVTDVKAVEVAVVVVEHVQVTVKILVEVHV